MIYVKLHKSYRNVLAVCDSNLIGKKFEEGIRQLECRDSFFKDKELTFQEAIDLMKQQKQEDTSFNIIGPESIKAALEAEIINPSWIKKVQDIPFILILL